jgi:hypothetical protein
MLDWIEVLKNYGIFAALTCYFIWRTGKDYAAVCKRLNEVEGYVRTTLVELIKDTTTALNRVNERLDMNRGDR